MAKKATKTKIQKDCFACFLITQKLNDIYLEYGVLYISFRVCTIFKSKTSSGRTFVIVPVRLNYLPDSIHEPEVIKTGILPTGTVSFVPTWQVLAGVIGFVLISGIRL